MPPPPLPPTPNARRRRRPRATVFIVLLFLVISAAGAYVAMRLVNTSNDEGVFSSPEKVELPALPADAQGSRDFLQGPEGQLLRSVLVATDELLAADDAEACGAAAGSLDTIGTPSQLFSAASGVPDPVTAEMAVAHMDALSRFLGDCLTTGVLPSPDELRFTATVLERRMGELG